MHDKAVCVRMREHFRASGRDFEADARRLGMVAARM